ncbi:MAG: tartrate dehydrogenase [Chloroflexi bacterium]|nr:tartrate dehydrogenase [Chloroflexota bacterium]|tara:strand:+ start:1398 stop:2462 length:1065 start_codon:yes stop_codon:yes gene_type:complete
MSKEYNIAVIKGDGIGTEVVEESLKFLNHIEKKTNIKFNFHEFPWGSEYYFSNGVMMEENGEKKLSLFDSIFLGAVGHPDIQDHITLNGLLLPIRRYYDQYICHRPSVLYKGVKSPLSDKKPGSIDIIVVRENTEGEYANIGGFQYKDTSDEVAVQTAVFTRKGCERVMEYSFELSLKRNKKVCSITKSNAQGYGMTLWDRVFEDVSKKYPNVETESLLIDAACMDFIRQPEKFDVVVASNLFGDILTDIAAMITGSLGLASSANINPDKTKPSMFEPTHGSAPDIAGKGIANPMAQILTSGLMMDHLGEPELARKIENSVKVVLEKQEIRSPDIGGNNSTTEVGNAIINELNL